MAKFKLKGENLNGSAYYYVQITTPLHRHEVCYLHTVKCWVIHVHTYTTKLLLQHIVSVLDII